MKAKTRIYVVGGPGGLSLIRAYSSVQARSFIAEQTFSVEVATQDTLVNLLSDGYKVVDAAKPETKDAFEPQCGTPCPEEKPVTDAEVQALRQSALAGSPLADVEDFAAFQRKADDADRSPHITEVA